MPSGKRFLSWQKKERAKRKEVAALAGGGLVALLGYPLVFFFVSPFLDRLLRPWIGSWLDVLTLIGFPWDLILAASVGLIGLLYALWSVVTQIRIGKGTPVPSVPTRTLIVVGPYEYSRNPMTFGSILLYLGVCMFFHSVAMIIVMVLVFVIPLSLYIKIVEEKELAVRFGSAYLKYKKRSRFMLPFPKRHRK
nr:isoprenylcysteine carboxylmethyltransferase family protein [Candidatus Njordarchaeota archaeon]